jgi:hypothetical protein
MVCLARLVDKYHDTDIGFLPLLLPFVLEEDEGPDHDVLAASRIGGYRRATQAVWNDQRETEPSVTES